MADDDTELSKEERLEAARKKFEDLKKKKKSKKKSKDDNKIEPPQTGVDKHEFDNQGEHSDRDSQVTSQVKSSDTHEQEIQIESIDDNADDKKPAVSEKVEQLQVGVNPSEDFRTDATGTSKANASEASDLLSSDISGGVTTGGINSLSSSSKEISQLSIEMREIKLSLSEAESLNQNLKNELLDLKLSKSELERELADLKKELQSYKLQCQNLKQTLDENVRGRHSDNLRDIEINTSVKSARGSHLVEPTKTFQRFNSFNNISNDYLNIVDVRERLVQWQGWNIDMRSWRSVGTGPLVEL
ncbi:hypothetical protein OGAPHI_007067 [Ogataea philodendri]|uniref:Uncharacterized protein n=1 Tax=Ogataea philodendri TaxID=1378263 RepID=A0A9P8SZJ5_9ASCO|nr:uncharacterized protein OGAPHI_007067 [Ogataea philodendri]KAH3660481.1 hypothetical protein OGAPHI_007067 [Ogataea philodendri]